MVETGRTTQIVKSVIDKGDRAQLLADRREILKLIFSERALEGEEYETVKNALEKLQVNDAAFNFEPETSQALGFGFRTGFLGLLHLDIITERIEREFNIDIITTAPSVVYKILLTSGEEMEITSPSMIPDKSKIATAFENLILAKQYRAKAVAQKKDYDTCVELLKEAINMSNHMLVHNPSVQFFQDIYEDSIVFSYKVYSYLREHQSNDKSS